MANAFEVKLSGFEPTSRRLEELPRKVQGIPAKRSLGKAAAVVKRAAKINAMAHDDPETGRRIADNVGQRLRTKYNRRTGNIMVSVGVLTNPGRIPKGNPDTGRRGDTPHWHLLELGTATMPAYPIIGPALDNNIAQALAAFEAEFKKQLDKLTS